MTSSALNGNGDGDGHGDVEASQSPAPPAFSPLTDPAPDTATREPSVLRLGPDPTDQSQNESIDSNGASVHKGAGSSEPRVSTASALGIPHSTSTSANMDLIGTGFHVADADPSAVAGASFDINMDLDHRDAVTAAATMASIMAPAAAFAMPPAVGAPLFHDPNIGAQLVRRLHELTAPQVTQQGRQNHYNVVPTVNLAQVSLDHLLLSGPPVLEQRPSENAAPAPRPSNAPAASQVPLESFATLEFPDSIFQMTTYSIIIGRDQRALVQARRNQKKEEEYRRRVEECERQGLPPPLRLEEKPHRFSKSYVSEEGGMLGPESDPEEENPRPAKRRKVSPGSASDGIQAAQGQQEEAGAPISDRQYVSHTPGSAPVDLATLRPDPNVTAFIGIHSPGPNISARTKAISRQHLRIEYNKESGMFEAIPLHRNGFFCDDQHCADGKVVLRSGARLQIKDVQFSFFITGVREGMTGAEDLAENDGAAAGRRYSEGGKEMSFEFESTHHADGSSSSPEAEEFPQGDDPKDDSDSDLSDPAEDMLDGDEGGGDQVMETIEQDTELHQAIKPEMDLDMIAGMIPLPPKKRGPGRPPKNGIMSKREERQRRKMALELAKKNQPPPPPGEPPVKRKVGRPRKNFPPEGGPDRIEKRKYKPRKPKDGEDGGGGSDPERAIKEKRREKPKTPPLELNKADYTEEQLQKPNKNYSVLIDEVLSAEPGGLTLKQVYKRIQTKYPYYYFNVDTKGWESSVRHNLLGNGAFVKDKETHMWSRVPGVDIEAAKKRKATSPDRSSSLQNPYHASPFVGGGGGPAAHQAFGAMPQVPVGFAASSLGQTGMAQHMQQHALHHQQQQQQQHQQHQPQYAQSFPAPAVGVSQQQPQHPQQPRPPYPAPTQAPVHQQAAVGYAGPATTAPLQPTASAPSLSYSSPYAAHPPAAAAPSAAAAAHPPARPPGTGAQSASPVANAPRPTAQAQARAGAPQQPPRPAMTNGNPPPVLKPAVAPELVRFVSDFKKNAMEQVTKRTPNAEAVIMSVINRGLGLTNVCTVLGADAALEKAVLAVFEKTKKDLDQKHALHPSMVARLIALRNRVVTPLEPRLGKVDAERLVLSAVDRVLGFADKSIMPADPLYVKAEDVLIRNIQDEVKNHQRALSGMAPASIPSPAPARPPAAAHPPPTAQSQAAVPRQTQAPPPPSPAPALAATNSMRLPQPAGHISTGPTRPQTLPPPLVTPQPAPSQHAASAPLPAKPPALAPAAGTPQRPATAAPSVPQGLPLVSTTVAAAAAPSATAPSATAPSVAAKPAPTPLTVAPASTATPTAHVAVATASAAPPAPVGVVAGAPTSVPAVPAAPPAPVNFAGPTAVATASAVPVASTGSAAPTSANVPATTAALPATAPAAAPTSAPPPPVTTPSPAVYQPPQPSRPAAQPPVPATVPPAAPAVAVPTHTAPLGAGAGPNQAPAAPQ